EKIKLRLNKIFKKKKFISDEEFISIFEKIINILEYVGKLSMPAFAIEDELKEKYKLNFLHAPELGKKLWLDHYGNVHRPYNLLKNRSFKMLEDLDEHYINVHQKNPPNYKL
ncbi:MAG: hypothetical protein PF487_12525, partial [Bacteroidales bacterium]|nr:hypothetical protein [Bacteroidales bacterium]